MKTNSIIYEGNASILVYSQSRHQASRRTAFRPVNLDFLPPLAPLGTNPNLICFTLLPPAGRGAALQPGSQRRGIATLHIGYQLSRAPRERKHVPSTGELTPRHVTLMSDKQCKYYRNKDSETRKERMCCFFFFYINVKSH